jgi:hypothetical protein
VMIAIRGAWLHRVRRDQVVGLAVTPLVE